MNPITYQYLADAVVVFHFAFVAFVVTGGLLVLRWRRVMWLHLPAVAWGVFVEFSGWLCPLTPLENRLREWAGEAAYQGGFVDHYIMPVLYPEGLTRNTQFVLGALIFLINLVCYSVLIYRSRKSRHIRELPAEWGEPVRGHSAEAVEAPGLVLPGPAETVPAEASQ